MQACEQVLGGVLGLPSTPCFRAFWLCQMLCLALALLLLDHHIFIVTLYLLGEVWVDFSESYSMNVLPMQVFN